MALADILDFQDSAAELWARSYVQWIAERSGQAVLKDALRERRNQPFLFGGIACALEWDGEAFKDIMAAVDEMMIKVGLL